jgi:uncharacterized protein
MAAEASLREVIEGTPWIDTHEHLVPERARVSAQSHRFLDAANPSETVIPSGWAALIDHYCIDDLTSAGLPPARVSDLMSDDVEPLAKWALAEPYIKAARNTGYLRAADISTEKLFGMRLSADTCEEIDAAERDLCRPGFYTRVLDVAGVERCQVHSIDASEDPCPDSWDEPFDYDLSLYPLVTGQHARAEGLAGIDVAELTDYGEVLEACFDRFAQKVIAVKCLWAYHRRLAVEPSDDAPTRSFRRVRKGDASPTDRRRVEDFLFLRALDHAAAHDLPVKLHVGYLAGNGRAAFAHLAGHVEDAGALAQSRPQNRFVLMHMGWPYQEHLIAAAKHLPNVTVDLCWAWILAPWSTTDFVCRFLTTVPATKLLCFGGDYMTAESIVGHAELARRGLEAALQRLIQASWLSVDHAVALAHRLMRENAEHLFPTRVNAGARPQRNATAAAPPPTP